MSFHSEDTFYSGKVLLRRSHELNNKEESMYSVDIHSFHAKTLIFISYIFLRFTSSSFSVSNHENSLTV